VGGWGEYDFVQLGLKGGIVFLVVISRFFVCLTFTS
jgi:hypothetical protein